MLKFWKFRLWNWKEIMTSQEQWFDGISYFDVGADGLVFRHIVDKVIIIIILKKSAIGNSFNVYKMIGDGGQRPTDHRRQSN